MKNKSTQWLKIFVLMLLTTVAFADWNVVETAGTVKSVSMVSADNGDIYIAFQDSSDALSVKRYDGSSWSLVGSAGFKTNIESPKIALDSTDNDKPWIVYKNLATNLIEVVSFDGNTWNSMGNPQGTKTSYPIIHITNSGSKYIAYSDQTSISTIANYVKTYSNGTWSTVGSGAASSNNCPYPSLATDSMGELYLAYRDGSQGMKATVRHYNLTDSLWEDIGLGISDSTANNTVIGFDTSDNLYIAYIDVANPAITVQKYDGSWNVVGSKGNPSGLNGAYTIEMFMDGDVPVVAYVGADSNWEPTTLNIMSYINGSWSAVGSALTTSSMTYDYPNVIAVTNSSSGYLAAFADPDNGDKLTVKKYSSNALPTLTTFLTPVETGIEDQQANEISFTDITAKGDEADSDGTVDAFVVQAVSTGTLKIGTNAGSATAFAPSTNDLIDATHNAYWTPYLNQNGTLNAFMVKAKDNDGALSATAVQVQVNVTATEPEIDVQGNGMSIVNGDNTPSATDHTNFGTTDYSASGSVVRTFTIFNTSSNDDLYLSGSPTVSISGDSAFTVTQQPTVVSNSASTLRTPVSAFIPASESRTFQVTFAPTDLGIKSATISITNDDANENPYTFRVQGEGIGDGNDGGDIQTEGMVPGVNGSNQGDGNGDGTQDYNQPNVTSGTFTNGNTTSYFTLVSDSGTGNSGVSNVGAPTNPLPEGVSMPYGQFSFTVEDVISGSTVHLVLFVPYNATINGYYKWNNTTSQWDELENVTITHYPADNKTKIEFSLDEGGPYDDNGNAIGLVDDGGPSISATPVPFFGPLGSLLLASLFGLFGYRRLKA